MAYTANTSGPFVIVDVFSGIIDVVWDDDSSLNHESVIMCVLSRFALNVSQYFSSVPVQTTLNLPKRYQDQSNQFSCAVLQVNGFLSLSTSLAHSNLSSRYFLRTFHPHLPTGTKDFLLDYEDIKQSVKNERHSFVSSYQLASQVALS